MTETPISNIAIKCMELFLDIDEDNDGQFLARMHITSLKV